MKALFRKIPNTLIFIVFAALLIRIIVAALLLNTFGEQGMFLSDSYRFTGIVENLLAGKGFSLEILGVLQPTAVFPPIYPFLLTASFAVTGSYIPVIAMQLMLGALIPLLVYFIGSFLTQKRGILIFAAALSAFEPFMILWNLFILTETVSLFLLLITILLFLKFVDTDKLSYGAAAAFFLGLSSLVRPNAQYLIILFAAYSIIAALWFLRRQRSKAYRVGVAAIIIIAVFVGTLGPWIARNRVVFGSFTVSTTGPRNVYSNFPASMIALKEQREFGEVNAELVRDFAKQHGIQTYDIRNNPSYSWLLMREGVRLVFSDIRYAIPTFAIITNAFFTHGAYLDYLARYGITEPLSLGFSPSVSLIKEGFISTVKDIWNAVGPLSFVALGGRLFWITIVLGAIIGSVALTRAPNPIVRKSVWVFIFIIVYYWLTTMAVGFGTMARMRYPVNPLLFLLSGVGLSLTVDYVRRVFLFSSKK
jgi:4-amino-4-deoxy-L-arabinose transferase-like glycosyltransferase